MSRSFAPDARVSTAERARLEELLERTSRTFAITIPLLPEPTRLEVTIAYLLFRIADTLEDATEWTGERKLAALGEFAAFLEAGSAHDASEALRLAAAWRTDRPMLHDGYMSLMEELPLVMRCTDRLHPTSRSIVVRHTVRTTRGMATFVARERGGRLGLRDVADLQDYCYAVAGIVGEMLTELFLLGRGQLAHIAHELRADASAFGEGLQLVNILKDSDADLLEGRRYLPVGTDRTRVFEMARAGLDAASRYCARLEAAGVERGLVASTALPIMLARATLDRIRTLGPGAKVGKAHVAALIARLQAAVIGGGVARLVTSDS